MDIEMIEATNEIKYRRNKNIVGASLDDEFVMMSVEHGEYFGLGGVAPTIWALLEQPASVEEIVDQIVSEYDVTRCVCRTDVCHFIRKMSELGLVENI